LDNILLSSSGNLPIIGGGGNTPMGSGNPIPPTGGNPPPLAPQIHLGGVNMPNINNPKNMDPIYINKLQAVYNKLSELIVSVDNKSPNKGLGMNSRNLVDLTFTAHNRQIMEQHITQFHPGMAHRFVTT
jgi:hypothetical protein